MLLKNYDFDWVGTPEDVGMRTGATIHTMNGLNLRPRRVSEDEPLPNPAGWWEKQHLKRGLSTSGLPYTSTEEVEMQTQS